MALLRHLDRSHWLAACLLYGAVATARARRTVVNTGKPCVGLFQDRRALGRDAGGCDRGLDGAVGKGLAAVQILVFRFERPAR
jgi:hypothetical protein